MKTSSLLGFALIFGLSTGCATTRSLETTPVVAADGSGQKIVEDKALAFSVSTTINAPAEVVWAVLTDSEGFNTWNSTVIDLKGTLALGETVEVTSIDSPDRAFKLEVSEFTPNSRMVWEDGMPMGMFLGVRTYELQARGDASTIFVMTEVFSGGFLKSISKSLPDMVPTFEKFAADLKDEAEARAAG